MDTLESLRGDIRRIDERMRALFVARCALAKEVGRYKRQHDLPVYDAAREAANRAALAAAVDPEWQAQYIEFLQYVMDQAKQVQHER